MTQNCQNRNLKRQKLSLSLPKDRFLFAIEDDDLKEAMKAYSTENTRIFNTEDFLTQRRFLSVLKLYY